MDEHRYAYPTVIELPRTAAAPPPATTDLPARQASIRASGGSGQPAPVQVTRVDQR
jgi:hypothetical protein